ncbi:MAG: carbohydrate ABC transporter permease [Clostridia bacterium]|nr:carbohydrate ABC transporter permease [Clostridia bacterium]
MSTKIALQRKKAWKPKTSGADRIFVIINSALLVLIFLVTLYPMVFVLSASFSDPKLVATGKMVLWPIGLRLDGYKYILQYSEIWLGYANTIFYTFVGTLLNLGVTLPCAYALSRHDMRGRSVIMTIFLITMYFSGGLIPGYLNVRDFGLLNTRWVLLITGLVSVYNLIVARTFFSSTIPWDLHEAAFLDGCGDWRVFFRIVLPLSKPIMVVLMLYYGISHWNAYFNAMIYLRDRNLFPLQVFLREILTQSKFAEQAMMSGDYISPEQFAELTRQAEMADMMKYCIIVVATAPMLIIYPWLQKFFAKGVMIGSVKG